MAEQSSAVIGNFVLGYAVLGTPNTYIPTVKKPSIVIYSSAMVPLVEIMGYETFTYIGNYYDISTWELTINRSANGTVHLIAGNYIGFFRPDGIWDTGLLENDTKILSKEGKVSEVWTVSGRETLARLGKRRCMHKFSTGDGTDAFDTAATETIIRTLVDHEAINPTNAKRVLPGLTLAATDTELGTDQTLTFRTESLLESVLSLRKTGGISCYLLWSGSGLNHVLTFFEGEDRSTAPDQVILSVDFNNIDAYNYAESIVDKITVAYVGGTGDGAARVLQTVYDGTEPEGDDRYETFVEATDCTTTDELIQAGTDVLTGETQTLEFEFNERSDTFHYGVDFFLGDIIVVEFPGVATMTSRLISVKMEITAAGRKLTLGVGKETPDMVSIVRNINSKIYPTIRR